MLVLLALHLVLALVAPVVGARLGRRVFLLVATAPAATAVWAAGRADDVLDGRPVTSTTAWVPGLDLTVDLRLDDVGTARPSDLATFFGIGKPTLSRQVQLLERLGLVTREADPTDGRAVQLTLSDDGLEKVHAARAARRREGKRRRARWIHDEGHHKLGVLRVRQPERFPKQV